MTFKKKKVRKLCFDMEQSTAIKWGKKSKTNCHWVRRKKNRHTRFKWVSLMGGMGQRGIGGKETYFSSCPLDL